MKILTGILSVGAALALALALPMSASAQNAPTVVQPKSDVAPLKNKISCFVTLGVLKSSSATLLLRTLDAAQARWDQGRPDQALALINTFLLYVERYEAAGLLPGWAADCLESEAQNLLNLWSQSG
jgi:hypothetical protein